MTKKRKWPLQKPPDVETRGFSLWKGKPGDFEGRAVMTVDYDAGEEVHESRHYDAFLLGYSLLVLAKRKGNQYWWAVKGKRPDGTNFIVTKTVGPGSLDEYKKMLAEFESDFACLFDIANALVTPGKHYSLYAGGYSAHRSEGER